ncbi:MAG: sortase [Actinomycetota bacterium]
MRILRNLGKLLISVGVGILLFVGWTLWGTGLYTARQQDRLASEFDDLPVMPIRPEDERGLGGPPKGFSPRPGDPVFRLRMPSIDLDHIVVEGVGDDELRLGPGHYPSCREGFSRPLCTDRDAVWPGEQGRVIVSGHRTTFGAPFWGLDKLEIGDPVRMQTQWGDFTYRVSGREIVAPNARDIANPDATEGFEIVFTTCNPKFSAAQRLLVFASMDAAARQT